LKYNALTPLNTITINVNVSKTGSYSISTPVTNGIKFSVNDVFNTTGVKTVTLVGEGIPTVHYDFPIEIMANTPDGNASCTATIPMTLPAMTYAVIGADNVYSWHPNNIRAKAFNSTSFGTSGKVRIVSLNPLWQTSEPTVAVTELGKSVKPDIVLYFSYGIVPTAALGTALSDYVNEGGVLIYGSRDNAFDETNIILDKVFGQSNAQRQVPRSGTTASIVDNVYPINNLPEDPIINGPFGNTAGKYWGEDNESDGSIIVTQLPPNSVQIASATNQFSKYDVNPEYSIIWYNDSKNFVYFGDSTGSTTSDMSLVAYPTIYTSTGEPRTKRYGQYPNEASQAQFCYNAALELNAIAWGIKKAAVSGINPH
jgi:hypothetical protein